MMKSKSDRLLAALDGAIQEHTPKRLNAPHVVLALESAVDRVLGRAGAGREASAKGNDFLARVASLTEALTTAPATRPAAPPPVANAPTSAAPALHVSPAWPILERYEALLQTDPRAAGEFYGKNADAISTQTGARNADYRRQLQAAQQHR